MKKLIFTFLLLIMVSAPLFALAAHSTIPPCKDPEQKTLRCLILDVTELISGPIITLVWALVFAAFLYGVALYVMRGGDAAKRKEGVKFMIYGGIALFVMVSIWGIVKIFTATFNLSNLPPEPPSFPEIPIPKSP